MAESVDVKNFRCFASAQATDCRRVNVIVGDNGGGKTAFMEAIFLAAANSPEVALRLRGWRGFENTVSGAPRDIERALWGDLFHNYDFKKTVSVMLKGSHTHTRALTMAYEERNITIPLSKKSAESRWSPVSFNWVGPNKRSLSSVTPRLLSDGKIEIPPTPETQLEAAFFAANHTYSSGEAATRFSELNRRGQAQEVIGHFRQLFSDIDDFSIEINAGQPMLFAKKEGMPEKVPLNALSGGMNKLACILFAIPHFKNGIVLIDEVDSGFYFKRLPDIWRSFLHFAEEYDVQIFASTHSIECLDAAADVAETAPDKFSVIYAGKNKLTQYGGEKFASAMEGNLEIR